MDDDDDDAEDVDEADIEQQMQRELNALNNNGSAAGPSSFVPIQLNCECGAFILLFCFGHLVMRCTVIFFAAPSDVDPVRICEAAVQDLLETGSTRSTCVRLSDLRSDSSDVISHSNILRLTPVTGLCSSADLNAFDALATATLQPLFSNPPPGVRVRAYLLHP